MEIQNYLFITTSGKLFIFIQQLRKNWRNMQKQV